MRIERFLTDESLKLLREYREKEKQLAEEVGQSRKYIKDEVSEDLPILVVPLSEYYLRTTKLRVLTSNPLGYYNGRKVEFGVVVHGFRPWYTGRGIKLEYVSLKCPFATGELRTTWTLRGRKLSLKLYYTSSDINCFDDEDMLDLMAHLSIVLVHGDEIRKYVEDLEDICQSFKT